MGLTYRDAGVDIDAGERLVDRIGPLARATRTPHVLSGIGGFAGLCGLPDDIEDPVLVSGTDGVGTKLDIAVQLDRHDTVGIDLVAMCVNDIITTGARPLFFLDYFATGKLDVDRATAVVSGIAEGCKQAECALLGGETAELPGFYDGGRYDLAGFAVGVVSRSKILTGAAVADGDVILGVASSGLHSNGFSLARKALLEVGGLALDTPHDDGTLGSTLLEPTKIYARTVAAALAAAPQGVHALCHVTGGGIVGNLPRVLPEGCSAVLDGTWHEPSIFDRIRKVADVPESEMRRTFNLGIGLIVVVPPSAAASVQEAMASAGETVVAIGRVVPTVETTPRVRYLADE